MTIATRIGLSKAASFLIIAATALSASSHAQSKAKAKAGTLPKKEALQPATSADSGGQIKFNTESEPAKKDPRSPLLFKEGTVGGTESTPPKPSEMDYSVAEDAPFKTYLGYPKYQLGPQFYGMNVASKWSYNAKDFNYSSSTTSYGLTGRIIATPQIKVELEYNHFEMDLTAATATPYAVVASSSTYNTYMIKSSFCSIGQSSFFNQFCGGFDVGYDAYPVLEFITGTDIALSRTTDIVVGVNAAYQRGFTDKLLAKATVGYNHGTGVGNAGSLSSKSNSSYYVKLAPEWSIGNRHTLTGLIEYKVRKAKLSGSVGGVTDTWLTDSSALTAGIGYLFTF